MPDILQIENNLYVSNFGNIFDSKKIESYKFDALITNI